MRNTTLITREDFLRPLLKSETADLLAGGATIGLILNLLPEAVDDTLVCDIVCKHVGEWVKRSMLPIPKLENSQVKYTHFLAGESNRIYDISSDFWNQLPQDTLEFLTDFNGGAGRYPGFKFNFRMYLHDEFKDILHPGVLNSIARAGASLFLLLPEFDQLTGVAVNHELLLNLWREMDA